MAEVAIAAVEAVFDWRSYLKEELSGNNTEKKSMSHIETIALHGEAKHWRKPKYRTADRMHGC